MAMAPTREELLSTLRRLSQLNDWNQLAAKTLSVIAEILFSPETDRSEERRKHSVYVAGFLYLDESSHRVDYQFFDETKGKAPGYTLRYLWKTPLKLGPFPAPDKKGVEEDAATFIDSLFYVMRKHQSPWGESQLDRSNIPEYLAWIPQLGESKENHDETHPRLNSIRELYGWHYCPYGEVAFYLYLWRLLLWSSVCFDCPGDGWYAALLEQDFDDVMNHKCTNRGITTIWNEDIWKERSGFEHHLFEWTYTADTKFGNPEIVKRGLDHFDVLPGNSTSIWSKELVSLLISTINGERDQAFQPVLRFAESVLVASHTASAVPPAFASDLLKRLPSLNASLRFAGDSVKEADSYLRAAAAMWFATKLGQRVGKQSWELALSVLHQQSRFPVIPYFYWNAIDRMPKTHAVVPIWRSWTNPVNAKMFLNEPASPLEASSPDMTQTSIVGLSVVALAPFQSDIQTQKDNENYLCPYAVELNQEDHERIQWIDEVLLRASLPQVDAHYYGDIERIRESQEGVALQDSMHHDQRKPLAIIETLLEDESIPQTDRLFYSRALVKSTLRKLRSYSAFAGPLYEKNDWKTEASSSLTSCAISQVINRSVILAILRAALDDSSELDTTLFAASGADLWCLLNTRLLDYMKADLGPPGDYSFLDANGRASVNVSYSGPDLCIPRSLKGVSGGPKTPRIYAGLSFAFDEIVLNTFRHQFYGSDLVAQHLISISVSVSSAEPYGITISFSPAVESSRKTVQRAIGLNSLNHVLKKIGCESKYTEKLQVETKGYPTVDRVLPYFKEQGESPRTREWGIEGIPKAALMPESGENGACSGV